jgi:hypothetical protein
MVNGQYITPIRNILSFMYDYGVNVLDRVNRVGTGSPRVPGVSHQNISYKLIINSQNNIVKK